MKKLLMICALMIAVMVCTTGLAREKNSQGSSTKENVSQEWVEVAANKNGVYYYDKNSTVYAPAPPQKVVEISLLAKANLLEENFKGQLREKYGKKLSKKDNVQECLLNIVLNKRDKTYKINTVELVSGEGKVLVKKELKEKFQPIPAKTFVGVLLEMLNSDKQVTHKQATDKPSDLGGAKNAQ